MIDKNMSRKGLPWSAEDDEYLRTHFLTVHIDQLAAHLGRPRTAVQKAAQRLCLRKDGKRLDAPDARPPNYKPVGATHAGNRGQLYVKVRDGGWPDAWRLLHHVNWEAVHGPIPPEHVLTFRNGDHADASVENLELVAKADWIKRYIPEHNYPPELANLIRLRAALVRQINKTTPTQESNTHEHPENS